MKIQISESVDLALEMRRVAIASFLSMGEEKQNVPFRLRRTNIKSPTFGGDREIVVSGIFSARGKSYRYKCTCSIFGGGEMWYPERVELTLANGCSVWPCKFGKNTDHIVLVDPRNGEVVFGEEATR